VELADPHAAVAKSAWETAYPPELIEAVLEVKGPAWVCDEIMREEDPSYVERSLERALLGYVEESAFAGKRLLDLGCGCGSSSLNLARLLEGTEVVGVELIEEFLAVARKRASFHDAGNVSFHRSPDGESLPEDIGAFDFVVLSAVWEHLLPAERATLLPTVWKHLKPGGVLFINQLPHRYSPFEAHTTGLPLINYLPDRLAHRLASSLSRSVERTESWKDLLRRGIRGGTANEIVAVLERESLKPVLLEPSQLGMSDWLDLWFDLSSGSRWPAVKKGGRAVLKALKRMTGITFVPELSLAIRKSPGPPDHAQVLPTHAF